MLRAEVPDEHLLETRNAGTKSPKWPKRLEEHRNHGNRPVDGRDKNYRNEALGTGSESGFSTASLSNHMIKETVSVSGSGKVTTYNWMLKSARLALDFAREKEEGRFFQTMNVLVYSAFAMEAYFNHLGAHLHSDWQSKERKLSKFKKLRQFNEHLNLNQDLDEEPYRSVLDVFDFRDALAHGKTEEVERQETVELTEDELRSYMIGTKWMDACTLANAERIFSNVEAVIQQLHKAAGLGDYPFIHYHSSAYSLA